VLPREPERTTATVEQMSRFTNNMPPAANGTNGTERSHRPRPLRTALPHRDHDGEADSEIELQRGSRSRKLNPSQLRFFPHHLPIPKTIFGIITIIGGVLLIATLFFQASEVLTPFVVAMLAMLVLYPFRSEPKLRPVLMAGTVIFLIWFVAKSIMVLLPFIIAFILAYITEPVVTKLQKKFYIKRWISALVATIVLVALLAVLLIYTLPLLIAQIGNAFGALDRLAVNVVDWAHSGGLSSLTGISQEKVDMMVQRYLLPKTKGLQEMMLSQAETAAAALPEIFSSALHFLMIPFLMFYFIKDYWKIRASIYSFIPQEYQKRSQRLLRDLDEVVGGFLRGDLITSVLQGTIIGVGLHVIGVDGALLLGVLTGFLTLIPFIGGVIAFVLAALAGLQMPEPGMSLLYVSLLFLGQSILESTVISPQIMGRHTDLHPLLVIGGILVFGFFGGVVGMLLAIPLLGLILRFAMRWRTRRHAEIEEEKVRADLERNPHHAKRGEELPGEVLADTLAGPQGKLP
jgi:predicted PurR-regulated permease PerM